MAKEVIAKIKNRSDTSTNWTNSNPILDKGELGLEVDNNKFKFGDGITSWNSLEYYPYVSDSEKSIWNAKLDSDDLPTSLPANGGNADTVDNFHLNQDVRKTASPTFSNLYIPSMENLKTNGSLTNKVIVPDVTQIAQTPVAPFLWHDTLAFCKIATPTFETSVDGSIWVNGALDKKLFSHKENQAITVLNPTNTKSVRWTWYSSQISWSNISWIILGITYVASAPNITVLIQSSSDGANWTTRHQSTYARSSMPIWHYMNSLGGDNRLRITITHNSGGEVKLSSIRALTVRWGDQGQGRELSFPYDWDENMNITLPKDLTVNGNINGFITVGTTKPTNGWWFKEI